MTEILVYLSNSRVPPPKNLFGLAIELNYGKDQFPQGQTVSITDFEWVRENYDLLIGYFERGLTGDVGITEGIPLRLDITNGTITKTVFQGFLDFTNVIIKDRIKITTKAVSHATVDWLLQVKESFTFEYLASVQMKGRAGYISNDMYKFMPYCNSQVPDYQQAAICTLMSFTILQSIAQTVSEIAELTIDGANPITAINAVLKAIIKVAYIILLLATLIKLIQDMIKFLISPVKYHAGMYVRDLMQKACEYLNLEFTSDVWASNSPYYNEFIIPEKLYNKVVPDGTKVFGIDFGGIFGFLQPNKNEQEGFFKGTFGKLLDAMQLKYNAKIVVTVPNGDVSPSNKGKLIFVRKDKNALPPKYQLPDLYTPEYTYNLDELTANYLIQFQTDAEDMNTRQNYAGTLYQVICQQKKVNYRPYVMIKDLTTVDIPFARASVKTGLTKPEHIIQDFLKAFDDIDSVLVDVANVFIGAIGSIIDVYNKIRKALKKIGIHLPDAPNSPKRLEKSHFANIIENRKGMMLLSGDHFFIPKILILKEGSESKFNKIDTNNATLESAKEHWDRFHYVNSFVPKQLNPAYSDRPTGNQYLIKEFKNVYFTWQNFLDVIANNRLRDSGGNIGVLESLKFYPPNPKESGKADIKVRFQKIHTLNLTETFLNPDGR